MPLRRWDKIYVSFKILLKKYEKVTCMSENYHYQTVDRDGKILSIDADL